MELLDFIEAYYSPARPATFERRQAIYAATPPDFELPDWGGQAERRTPVSPEALIQRSEARLPYHHRQPGSAEKRLRNKCRVEFVMD